MRWWIFGLLALGGCAYSSKPMDLGGGVHAISAHAAPARGGQIGARAKAVATAEAFCADEGRRLVTKELTSSLSGMPAGGTASITFECAP